MILIDDSGHMVATTCERDLHDFAAKLGLKRAWYQQHPWHPHYDLTTPNAKLRAEKAGARRVDSRTLMNRAWWAKRHPRLGAKVNANHQIQPPLPQDAAWRI